MSHKEDRYLLQSLTLPKSREKMEYLNNIYGISRPKTPKKRQIIPKRKPRRSPTPLRVDSPSPRVESPPPIVNVVSSDDEDTVSSGEVEIIFPPTSQPKQTIHNLRIGETLTELKMIPIWFEPEDQQEALRHIVYPSNIVDQRPFDSVARYRAAFNITNNFRKKAIESNTNSTEPLIIALDKFAQQFDGDLSFTKKEISFNESAHRTACGIATLGSAHLLATNHIPSARFLFHTDLNYKKDLAKSDDTMSNFILGFSAAVAEVLDCESIYVRVFTVEKNDNDEGNAKVNFGITTPEQRITETLANDLEDYARSGFRDNKILKHVKPGKYPCYWMPLLTYLQLQPHDFATQHDFDYKKEGLQADGYRGGYPYHVPLGWYRHGLDVSKKYPGDDRWLGHTNIPGEWPVAFHGTHAEAVSNITKDGLSIDKVEHDEMREEAVQQMGPKADSPGLYLATRCKGGAHPWYTKTFSVYISEKKTERFRVVFQCRVKPGEFTVHQCPLTSSETWRVVDPSAVRPYGILVRKRKAPKKVGDESESDNE